VREAAVEPVRTEAPPAQQRQRVHREQRATDAMLKVFEGLRVTSSSVANSPPPVAKTLSSPGLRASIASGLVEVPVIGDIAANAGSRLAYRANALSMFSPIAAGKKTCAFGRGAARSRGRPELPLSAVFR
jgi:hypothetical protein